MNYIFSHLDLKKRRSLNSRMLYVAYAWDDACVI